MGKENRFQQGNREVQRDANTDKDRTGYSEKY